MVRQAKIIKARQDFFDTVTKRGFTFIGPYISARCGVDVICPKGHPIKVNPLRFRQGAGCKRCLRKDSQDAAVRFNIKIAELGGIIMGKYINAHTKVECVCEKGHVCKITPNAAQKALHLCRQCVTHRDEVIKEFYDAAKLAGVTIIGEYKDSRTPVACKCPKGHDCSPRPTAIQQGWGFCNTCGRAYRKSKK